MSERHALSRFDLASLQARGPGILDIGTVLVVGMVEQYFVQASPIKDFAAFGALRKMLLFFGRKLFVFVERGVFLV